MSDYKLMLGDTIEKMMELDAESVDLIVTSPPYPGAEHMWGNLFSTENFEQAHVWLDSVWDECVRVLRPGCKLIVNIADMLRSPYLDNSARIWQWPWNNRDKVEVKGKILWLKGLAEKGDTAWGSWLSPSDIALTDNHEFILVFRKSGKRASPSNFERINRDDFLEWRKSEWVIKSESAKKINHAAPFPLEIPKRLVTLYSFEGETVLDPFMGSGTTLVAALMLKRKGIGIEHNQTYIDLAADRINNAAFVMGKEPRRFKNGATMQPLFVA